MSACAPSLLLARGSHSAAVVGDTALSDAAKRTRAQHQQTQGPKCHRKGGHQQTAELAGETFFVPGSLEDLHRVSKKRGPRLPQDGRLCETVSGRHREKEGIMTAMSVALSSQRLFV